MFNLKETDVEYYINKEKRTVVCRLKGKNWESKEYSRTCKERVE